ncbi:hypothetical protein GGX14DRAFT_555396 [Mycena pura]|uniref:HNH nuclease domain-containing protein n=1 Tax=Mycena pura TaxID=153505 RepID=A0AAD6YQQ7_9AGAR|nr:hypothetical protein GGX14DRAFT_555396 [Mycena pura]
MASSSAAGPSTAPRRNTRQRTYSMAFHSEADNAPTTPPDTTRLVESSRILRPREKKVDPLEGGLGDTVDVADWDSDKERVSLSEEEDEEEDFEPDYTGTKTEPQRRKHFSKGKARATFESPKKRLWVPGTSVKTEVKAFVRAVDPNKGRCILTGMADPAIAIQFAHIIARRTQASVLTLLEFHWRLPYYTLNIDTRYNVGPIKADNHLSMDAGHWALVPHYADLDKIEKWVGKRKDKNAAKDRRNGIANLWKRDSNTTELEKHTYYMLPLSDALQNVPIFRLPPNREFLPKVSEERHVFPFRTLGPLTSHIQPHFAVFAAGAKLAAVEAKMGSRFEKWLNDLANNAPSFGYTRPTVIQIAACLQKIRRIYETWTSDDNLPPDGHDWYKRKK